MTVTINGSGSITEEITIDGVTVGQGGGNVSTNTAVGASALDANTTGAYNVAVGRDALGANVTGGQNTAVGQNALLSNTASDNTAVGRSALSDNTSGGANTAVGREALTANTTASYNTAVGYQAGYSNTTATRVTAIGMQAGYSGTTGSNYSTYVGYKAGYFTTGQGNVFIGDSAGESVTTGSANTFIGANNAVTGSAGQSMTTGSKNTIIGAYTGNQGGLDIRTSSNYIVLSDGDGNPRLHIDNNGGITQTATGATIVSVGVYNQTSGSASNLGVASNGVIYRSTSSLKYKRDVADASHGLAEVLQLRSVTYKGKSIHDGETVFGGLIAEEVHDAGLTEFVQYAEDGSPDSLAYGNMVSLCIKAIQELKAEVDSLKAQLNP